MHKALNVGERKRQCEEAKWNLFYSPQASRMLFSENNGLVEPSPQDTTEITLSLFFRLQMMHDT